MSFLRAFCNGGVLAARSAAARSTLVSTRPNMIQNSVKLYRTSSPLTVGARSALYRFDFDNGHNEQTHWKLERVLAYSLPPVIAGGLAIPSPIFDYIFAGLITVHLHMGMDAIVFDYLHYRPKLLYVGALALVYACSIVALAGLTYFTYSNIGLFGAIRQLWKIEGKKN